MMVARALLGRLVVTSATFTLVGVFLAIAVAFFTTLGEAVARVFVTMTLMVLLMRLGGMLV